MESGIRHQRSAARLAETSCLLFQVGSRLCALPVTAVVETMRPLPIQPFANAPPGVRGLAVVRGVPLPVLELARLLDGDSETTARFITVKIADRQIVLAVGAVLGVEAVASAALQQLSPLLGVANAQTIGAIGAIDSQLLLLLNAARLIDDATNIVSAAGPSL
jgi:purine-binding chemotaxis protein CheW